MKKILTATLVLVVTVAFSGMALAQMGGMGQSGQSTMPGMSSGSTTEPMQNAPAKTMKKMASMMFRGSVVSVDPNANTIVVKGIGKKGMEKTFSVDPAAKLMMNKKTAMLSEYTAGTKVAVTYKMDNDKMVATAIK